MPSKSKQAICVMNRTENLQAFGVRTPDVLTSYFRAYRLAQFSRDAIAERFPRARKKRSAGASRLNVADERTLARGGANPIRSLIETRGPVKGWAHSTSSGQARPRPSFVEGLAF